MKVNVNKALMFDDYDFKLNTKTVKQIKVIKASKPKPAYNK
jgi:hypothetical protein